MTADFVTRLLFTLCILGGALLIIRSFLDDWKNPLLIKWIDFTLGAMIVSIPLSAVVLVWVMP